LLTLKYLPPKSLPIWIPIKKMVHRPHFMSCIENVGKYLGDIVVGDIGQPQCHTCTKKQKNIVKEKEERHLWYCSWPMLQCHSSATRKCNTWDTLYCIYLCYFP